MEEGQTVRLITPVIQGQITDTRYNKDAKGLEHLVNWTDANGNVQERWFIEGELEVVA
jgi:hypothetical protein